jgi:hypothetical protein
LAFVDGSARVILAALLWIAAASRWWHIACGTTSNGDELSLFAG